MICFWLMRWLRATVKDGKLVKLDLLEHRYNRNFNGEPVIKQILEKQSLEVDGVSGATYSSKSIIKATERALKVGIE
ncbi:MAG: FMN-binding protein [Fibrobacter sp.]|nr:FMN-binding protein [Fibrobacter sp.]